MINITIKRAFAYIIDLMIVLIISTLFSGIEALNPYDEEYEEAMEKYQGIYTNTMDIKSLNSDETVDILYDVSKYGLSISIINLVVTSLYFIVFQYINGGRTIGKRLMKIKVVSKNRDKLRFDQVLIRSLIINSILTSFILIMLLACTSKDVYLASNKYVQFIDMLFVFVSIIMILFRKDYRGLHDLVAKTEVIYDSEDVSTEMEDVSTEIETKIFEKINTNVKEATFVEKKNTKKRKKSE